MPGETIALIKCFRTEQYCSCLSCVCCGRATSHRLVMTIFSMFGIILAYTHRVCLSLAITEMTIPIIVNKNDTLIDYNDHCPIPSNVARPVIMDIHGGKYDWDEQIQSFVLAAFYVGYLIMNIPAGYMCDRWGAKWIIIGGCLISSITTLLIPVVTIYSSWICVVVMRMLTGMGQAALYPGATQLMARWIPEAERSLVGGVVLSSLSIGTIAGNIPTAFILEELKSWVWVFYMYGICGLVYCMFFALFVYSTPYSHPHITREESDYLQPRIPEHETRTIPCKAIWSDFAVWGCIICQIGNDYTLFTIITNFPKYLNDVLKFSSKEAGLIVCIPQVALFFGSISFGLITDALILHAGIKTITMRILNTLVATTLPTVALVICCKLRCHRIGAILAITMGMVVKSMFYGGLKVSIIDITRHHTGLVAAIVNGAGAIAGAVAPYTIGMVAKDNTFSQWDLVAYISLAISAVSIIPYALFCKANRSSWDYSENDPTPPEEKTGWIRVFSWVNRH